MQKVRGCFNKVGKFSSCFLIEDLKVLFQMHANAYGSIDCH